MSRDMYYTKRDARVVLEKILRNNGFEIYGYKEDESDAMTDYFSPADWDGIATKGRYIAIVDNKGKSGFEILLNKEELNNYRSKIASMTQTDREKIEKLQALANRTNFEGEKENALEKINAIKNKKFDTVEVIAKYQKLDFPATNFMIFIYDTIDNGIVYKSNSISDWAINELYYNNQDFNFVEGYLQDNFNYENCNYRYREYTEEELKKLKKNRTEILQKVNNFVKELKGLDTKKEIYKEVETNKKGVEFEEITINSFEDIEKNKNNIYIDNWKGEKCKLTEMKKGFDYSRKEIIIAEFKKIKKDGSIASVGQSKRITSGDRNIENIKFYVSKSAKLKAWKLEKRGLKLENKTGEEVLKIENNNYAYNIVENEKLNGFEVRFSSKPKVEIIEKLKNNGFRWSGLGKFWYIKQNKISKEKMQIILAGGAL